jgi:hypothetical protein
MGLRIVSVSLAYLLLSCVTSGAIGSRIDAAEPTRDELHKTRSLQKKLLAEPISIDFKETRILDVIDELASEKGIKVQWDHKSLEIARIGTDVPVTIKSRKLTREEAIRAVLKELKLSLIIEDAKIVITTPDAAERRRKKSG